MDRLSSNRALLRLAAATLAGSFVQCTETPTQILIRVDGNLSATRVARIDFALGRDGGATQQTWSCLPGFPYSFAANPPAGQSSGTLRVRGTALSESGEVLVESEVEGSFQKNRLLVLPIRFDAECEGVLCEEGASCVSGSCVPIGAEPLAELEASPQFAATNQCGDFEPWVDEGTAGSGERRGTAGSGGSAGDHGGEAAGGTAGGGTSGGYAGGGLGGGGVSAGGGVGGAGGTSGAGGGAGGRSDGVVFEEDFENANEPLAAWLEEGDLCNVEDKTSAESSTDHHRSGSRSLKITVDTAHNADGSGVDYTLVRPTLKEAAYYSAWYYVVGEPVRDPIYGYFAFFDFLAPNYPGASCSSSELWNLNLGKYGSHKLTPFLWFGNPPLTNKEVHVDSRFTTDDWVHIEVRLDYYGPKKKQYQLWKNGEPMFTVDDLGPITKEPILWRVGLSANWLTPSRAIVYIDDVKISTKPVGHVE